MASAAHDKIVKLVFIRIEGGADGARKTVVPLVEGCDFSQFLARVRRRLGLAEDARVALSDAATGPVDSIDRLLEVDESATLIVHVPDAAQPSPLLVPPAGGTKACCSSTSPGSSSSTMGAATHRAPRPSAVGLNGGSSLGAACQGANDSGSSTATHECRVDVPVSEWTRGGGDGEETGALKYRKRRRDVISIVRSAKGVLALTTFVGLAFGAMHVLS